MAPPRHLNGTTSLSLRDVPEHVAIIMDGNGRWATQKGLSRGEGHTQGAIALGPIVEESRKLGIRYLTLFSFSTENWNRPPLEVRGLMKLFRRYLDSELRKLKENGIRLRAVGNLDRLPFHVRAALRRNIEETHENTNMDLVLAISYGGREEIIHAARKLAEEVREGKLQPSEINSEIFSKALWTEAIPDPDLLIRTSGEMRISNFLLWQLAYAEMVVTPKLWPDFSVEEFHRCLAAFKQRERRFGLSPEQLQAGRIA